MDLDDLYHLAIIGAVISFIIFLISFVGELRGWWGFIGLVGSVLGGLSTMALTFIAIVLGAGRGQVRHVSTAVLDSRAKLDTIDRKLDKLDKLEMLDAMDAKLTKLDKLDVIQLELDDQTGVLDEQVGLLTEIRDALVTGAS